MATAKRTDYVYTALHCDAASATRVIDVTRTLKSARLSVASDEGWRVRFEKVGNSAWFSRQGDVLYGYVKIVRKPLHN